MIFHCQVYCMSKVSDVAGRFSSLLQQPGTHPLVAEASLCIFQTKHVRTMIQQVEN